MRIDFYIDWIKRGIAPLSGVPEGTGCFTMAKVLLFTINDINASNIRLQGAYLRKRSSDTVQLIILGNDSHSKRSKNIPDSWLNSPGGFSSTSHRYSSNMFLDGYTFGDFIVPSAFLNYIQLWQPDIICYSGAPTASQYCPALFADIRTALPEVCLLASGFGPSTTPEFYLDSNANIVIRGESEETLAELTEFIGKKLSWEQVRNISWKVGDNYYHNPLRPVLPDLDSLPIQLLNEPGIFYIKNNCLLEVDPLFYNDHSTAYLETSRGCLNACSYCAMTSWHNMYTQQGLNTPKYRRHSIEYIMQELHIRKSLGQKIVSISDECFFRPPQELLEFLQRYKQEINLPIVSANFSPSIFEHHPEIFEEAIRAGLQRISIQVQSGDGELCEQVFSRKNNYPLLIKFAHYAAEKYLFIHTDIIDGYIFNEQDDLDSKFKFIRNLPAFNPKFPYSTMINVLYLRREIDTPLDHKWSEYNARWINGLDFAYRVMLMQLRYILDDDDFFALCSNSQYKNDPRPLARLNYTLRNAKHNSYVLEQAKLLSGKKVWFYGCDEIYQKNKDLFFSCKPQGVLLNNINSIKEIDGFKAYSIEEVLSNDIQLPIVIFSTKAQEIAQKIKRLRPDYTNENIISCQIDS